jgi:hypothetical protein
LGRQEHWTRQEDFLASETLGLDWVPGSLGHWLLTLRIRELAELELGPGMLAPCPHRPVSIFLDLASLARDLDLGRMERSLLERPSAVLARHQLAMGLDIQAAWQLISSLPGILELGPESARPVASMLLQQDGPIHHRPSAGKRTHRSLFVLCTPP